MAQRFHDRQYTGQGQYEAEGQARSNSESDPLAELARLIGQTDAFGAAARDARRQPTFDDSPADRHSPANNRVPDLYATRDERSVRDDFQVDPATSVRPSWMKHVAEIEPQAEVEAAPEIKPVHPLRRHLATPTIPEPVHEPEPVYASQQGYQPEHAYAAEPSYAAQPAYAQSPAMSPDAYQQPNYSASKIDPDRYDDALYGKLPVAPPMNEYGAQDQGYDQDYDDYEEEPKSRKGLKTVALVMALAVVGTGGAFAYRTFMGPSRSGEPPVIRADTSPNKVVPQAASAEGKSVQDRLAGGQEKLVSREEQPVRVEDNVVNPRMVFPPPHQMVSQPPATVPATMEASAGSEPRRVRTLSVRGDSNEASTPAARQAPARIAAPPAPERVAAAAAPVAAAPMSISPQARQTTTASLPQSGGFVVQVASQRSETDAQSSFRQIKSKYSAVLGSHSATIRRADLGDRGIYYRAMVGPFGSQEEASRICSNLKSAGGQCVVQRN